MTSQQVNVARVDSAALAKADLDDRPPDPAGRSRVDEAVRLCDEGLALLDQRRFAEAHVLLARARALDPANPNLSFEREFGKVIGLLDFLSKVVADKHGRAVTRLTQSIATAAFLPVIGL